MAGLGVEVLVDGGWRLLEHAVGLGAHASLFRERRGVALIDRKSPHGGGGVLECRRRVVLRGGLQLDDLGLGRAGLLHLLGLVLALLDAAVRVCVAVARRDRLVHVEELDFLDHACRGRDGSVLLLNCGRADLDAEVLARGAALLALLVDFAEERLVELELLSIHLALCLFALLQEIV